MVLFIVLAAVSFLDFGSGPDHKDRKMFEHVVRINLLETLCKEFVSGLPKEELRALLEKSFPKMVVVDTGTTLELEMKEREYDKTWLSFRISKDNRVVESESCQ